MEAGKIIIGMMTVLLLMPLIQAEPINIEINPFEATNITGHTNINVTRDIETNQTGFFRNIGSSVKRVLTGWFNNLDVLNTLNVSGTINVTQDINVAGIGARQFLYNQTSAVPTAFDYNQTIGTFNQYGKDWYNHTLVFNNTYGILIYNHTRESNISITSAYGKFFYNQTQGINSTFIYNQTLGFITKVQGNIDFNGNWADGGLSIISGDLYAQNIFVYNISGLNVTTLNTNGSILPSVNNSFDLGSGALVWNEGFFGSDVFVNGVSVNKFLYNQSAVTDITKWLYNQSLSPTITIWLYNQTGIFGYNQSLASFNQYGQFWYNQSATVSTIFNYNQTKVGDNIYTLYNFTTIFLNETQLNDTIAHYTSNISSGSGGGTFTTNATAMWNVTSRQFGFGIASPNITTGVLVNGSVTIKNDLYANNFSGRGQFIFHATGGNLTYAIPINWKGFFFHSEKNAFRSGEMNATTGADDQIGMNTFGSGYRPLVRGENAVGIGYQARALGQGSIAIGDTSPTSLCTSCTVIGSGSFANYSSDDSTVLGAENAVTSGTQHVLIGFRSFSSNTAIVNVGARNNGTAFKSVLVGEDLRTDTGSSLYVLGFGFNTTTPLNLTTTGTMGFGMLSNIPTMIISRGSLNNIGNVTIGTATSTALFVAGVDKRVGIGTRTPNANLEINGTGTYVFNASNGSVSGLLVSSLGRVGIGTPNPLSTLHVEGSTTNAATIRVRGTGGINPSILIGSTESGALDTEGLNISYINNVGESIFNNIYTSSTNAFRFQSGGTDRLVIQNAGNVGIGTPNPSWRLDVNGTGNFSGDLFLNGTNLRTFAYNQSAVIDITQWLYNQTTAFNNSMGVLIYNHTREYNASMGVVIYNYSNVIGGFVANATAIWNSSTRQVGIGTSSPNAKLEINGTDVYVLNITNGSRAGIVGWNNGSNINLGVGNIVGWNPQHTLTVYGSINLSNSNDAGIISSGQMNLRSSAAQVMVASNSAGANGILLAGSTGTIVSYATNLIFQPRTSGDIIFTNGSFTNGRYASIKGNSGFLGLGTSTPNAMIEVNGTFGATNLLNVSNGSRAGLLVNSLGRVGIGTANPDQLLDVRGNANISNGNFTVSSINKNVMFMPRYSGNPFTCTANTLGAIYQKIAGDPLGGDQACICELDSSATPQWIAFDDVTGC